MVHIKRFSLFLLLFFLLIFKSNLFSQKSFPVVDTAVPSLYEPQDFSYLLGHLDGIDDDLLKMHFTLYKGYVKNVNLLILALQELEDQGNALTFAYGALKRRFSWEYDGMILHEYYFSNLKSSSFLARKDPLYQQLIKDFGSFEAWKNSFLATAMIRGIGWVILYYGPKEGRLKNVWVDEHHMNHLAGDIPLLVLDLWEHAYITKYGLNRKDYIKAFFKNINWKVVSSRFNKKGKIDRTSR